MPHRKYCEVEAALLQGTELLATDEEQAISARIFDLAKAEIPTAKRISEITLDRLLGDRANDVGYIKENFSKLVSDAQILAYRVYQEHEAVASAKAMRGVISEYLPEGAGSDDVFDFLKNRFGVLDRFFLSLTQSRRPRAGQTFEQIVSRLFDALSYPYTPQPELGESRPDYVLPSIEHYQSYAADCIIFTCKRTLRERWRQVVTEGATGQSFYLATIDEKLSAAELSRMKERKVVVVVPAELNAERYADALNVISFETFLNHHLDAAMGRWRAAGTIT